MHGKFRIYIYLIPYQINISSYTFGISFIYIEDRGKSYILWYILRSKNFKRRYLRHFNGISRKMHIIWHFSPPHRMMYHKCTRNNWYVSNIPIQWNVNFLMKNAYIYFVSKIYHLYMIAINSFNAYTFQIPKIFLHISSHISKI